MVAGVLLAQIGPFTATLEAMAASVGAGVILGGVVLGSVRLAVGWPRWRVERRALTDGYLGGLIGMAAAIVDAILRYLV